MKKFDYSNIALPALDTLYVIVYLTQVRGEFPLGRPGIISGLGDGFCYRELTGELFAAD